MKVTLGSLGLSVLATLWLLTAYGLGTLWGLLRLRHPDSNRDAMRLFSWGMRRITGLRVEVLGRENLPETGAAIFVANHQGGLDLATFGQNYPARTVVVAKRELLWVPLLGTYFLATGNLMINRKKGDKSLESIRRAAQAMKARNLRIGMFPEGTRNSSYRGLLPFKRGAFILAIESQLPVCPMVATSYEGVGTFENGTLRRGGRVTVSYLPPVSTAGLTPADVPALAEKVRALMLAELQRLQGGRP